MNRLMRTITAVLVIGVCGASLASAQTQTSAAKDCMISGHVRTTSGSPINGAPVIVEGVRDAITPATGYYRLSTDENGIYQVVVPVGIYNVSVYPRGYQSQQQRAGGQLSAYGPPACSGADFTLSVGREAAIPTNDNRCIDPQTSTTANIVRALNAKVGQLGGPSKRVSAIRRITHQDADNKGRCRATLVFASGDTQTGFLLKDSTNGVPSWRWVSDQYIAESPAQRAAPIYNAIRKSAEKNPDRVVVCGVEGPKTVYTTNAVCYAIISFDNVYHDKLKPYAGYSILQSCGAFSSSVCLGIIQELRSLAPVSPQRSKMRLVDKCADDLKKRFPGNEKSQYLNACQDLVGNFR